MIRIFKRFTAFLLAISAALILLTSCGNKNPEIPDGMMLVESKFVSCKLFVPDTWIVQNFVESDTGTSIIGAKTNDNSNISLVPMTPSGSYEGPDHYFRTDYFPKIQSTFKDVVLIENECSTENQKFGKQQIPCVKYVYTAQSDGASYKIMQYFLLNAGYLYIFTYTASEAVFAEHLEEVASIVENVVF